MKKTIGGYRLGSGHKMMAELKNYERSTHDLGYIWRSSMAPGTLVPFLVQVALPGDTFDIDLNADVKTHPTLGPLFGSFKLQLDVFEAPVRLYHSALMQNMVAIGNNMSTILLPQLKNTNIQISVPQNYQNPDNTQVNSSALLAYLGIRGWGWNRTAGVAARSLSALPLLAYWDIYKNYYANKQETSGYFITAPTTSNNITGVVLDGVTVPHQTGSTTKQLTPTCVFSITFTGTQDLSQVSLNMVNFGTVPLNQIGQFSLTGSTWTLIDGTLNAYYAYAFVNFWDYIPTSTLTAPTPFPLSNIDDVKKLIMATPPLTRLFFTSGSTAPYGNIMDPINMLGSQNGLALKTYQSDLFNNWMQTTWYTNIQSTTAVSTASGSFAVDTLILAKKVYEYLTQVAISGGTYLDWINAAYSHNPYSMCYTPMYHGGLSKEVVFQEVISMAATQTQPIGTLAGRGTMAKKHKGGKVHIKVNEPGYIIGIVSLTPRLDYSQGNAWHVYAIDNMDNFHKPALDQIGFQSLITEQMAWWDTHAATSTTWTTMSAGFQPAWLNYMTEVNKTYGNFAVNTNEMFMTLNRRYAMDPITYQIQDLTTYINPAHYNFIFAQTAIDAQNFWTQIAVDMIVRRKMSAKIMPNL